MTETLTIHCPGCGAALRASIAAVGRRAKCPRCGGQVVVEQPGSAAGDPEGAGNIGPDSKAPSRATGSIGVADSSLGTQGADVRAPVASVERPQLDLADDAARPRLGRRATAAPRGAGRGWRGWVLAGGVLSALAVVGVAHWSSRQAPELVSASSATAPSRETTTPGPRLPSDRSASDRGTANQGTPDRGTAPADSEPPSSSVEAPPDADDAPGQTVDVTRLWESPTAGAPVEWRFAPTAARLLVAIRPRALREHPEGPRLVDALGPLVGAWIISAESALGRPLDAWDRIEAGAWSNDAGQVEWCFVGECAEELAQEEIASLGEPWTPEAGAARAWLAGDVLRWLPDEASTTTLVAGPRDVVAELIAAAGTRPDRLLPLAALARSSDSERLVSLVFAPEFLVDEGQGLWRPHAPRLESWWPRLWGDEAMGVALDLHLDQDLFAELRYTVPGSSEREVAAARRRVSELPGHLATPPMSSDSPAGRFGERWGGMLEIWQRFTTLGTLGDQVVVRSYLPAAAAHNLAWGARLNWREADPAAVAATPTGGAPRPLAERLREKLSLALPRNPLERALTLFGEELGATVTIDGAALEREGITRNQSLAFEAQDLPAGEVLAQLLLRANPDGKLTFVIEPDPAGGERLKITTRTASPEINEPDAAETDGGT